MNKSNTNPNNFQLNSTTSRRDLLEQTKLSRLPHRTPFKVPDLETGNIIPAVIVAVCVGCGGRLESDNDFQQSIKVCRKCLAHYAKNDLAIDEASKRKRRELLEKFAAEVNE